ncbi:MAG: hypothetical protein JWP57_4194 [Spirosoma sp.]|nr:hypothetical protein [Spirosoma sp.]
MFDQATEIQDEIGKTPFIQRDIRNAAPAIPIVGKKTRAPSRYDRRRSKDRLVKFKDAVAFAYAVDLPLNMGITITWAALLAAGEHNEGNCLRRGEWDRESYLRDELARMCRKEGLEFAALWGRDVGKDMGAHVHMAMFWPSRFLAKLVILIERVTGSAAAYVLAPYAADTVAQSLCGGWKITMNNRNDDKASAIEWAGYIADQHSKHPAPPEIKGKAFGISQAIGTSAQECARGMLEAREAQYAWMRGKRH